MDDRFAVGDRTGITPIPRDTASQRTPLHDANLLPQTLLTWQLKCSCNFTMLILSFAIPGLASGNRMMEHLFFALLLYSSLF